MKEKRASASLFGLLMENYMSDEEESSDESFRVEDHTEHSDLSNDDEDISDDSSDSEKSDDSEDNEPKKSNKKQINNVDSTSAAATTTTVISAVEKLAEQTKSSSNVTDKLLSTPICCACLSDISNDSNEIVTCDCCKITVHEGCYGVSDSASISSTVSSCSTEPWFCEPCKANIKNPDCELCPNKGGIFKETDCGKWVHLVCALYVPGVAFGEVDQLSSVTLFEMQYNKWGAKSCSLCENDHFVRTGVCIGCDAGMCKNFFHVTCAQREGLLSEAHHEEADQADPFYAHCRAHSDKFLIKHRKKNYNALVMQMKRNEAMEAERIEKNQKLTEEQERIERKLKNQRIKYATHKMNRPEPWVPTQKMSRALITSASAVKKLTKKAELMEIDSVALEFQEAQIASLTDIRKKWHIPPAFSTEFVGYYLDRSIRMREMKANLEQQVECNKSLLEQQSILRVKYDDAIKINQDVQQKQKDLISEIEQLHSAILSICPNKPLMNIESIVKSPIKQQNSITQQSQSPPPQQSVVVPSRTMSVPTAAARKQGVGFPLNHLKDDSSGRILSTQCPSNNELLNECGICKKCNDQHLLAKCDTCHLYYHLGCLNPPLTRHPKRSKLYAWQCSECDKSDHSDDQTSLVIPKGPRKSRNVRYSKEGIFPTDILIHNSFGSDKSLNNLSSASSSNRIPNGNDYELLDLTVMPSAAASSSSVNITTNNVTIETSTPKNIVKDNKRVIKKRRESIALSPATKLALKKPRKPKKKPSEISLNPEIPQKEEQKEEKIPLQLPPEIPLQQQQKPPVNENSITENNNHNNHDDGQKQQISNNKPKRGRPKKANSSNNNNTSSSADDSMKHNEQKSPEILPIINEKPPTGLLDLSQYRAFANIPNSIQPPPSIQQQQQQSSGNEEVKNELFVMNGTSINGNNHTVASVNDIGLLSGHHKHKKRKSHKRRHSHSPSSADRQSTSSGKKHKRKHKHKDHEVNSESEEHRPAVALGDQKKPLIIEQPRIKIKFRAILQNAGDDKKPPKFLWHVPIENNEESHGNQEEQLMENGNHSGMENGKKRKLSTTSPTKKKTKKILMNLSPDKKDTAAQLNESQVEEAAIANTESSNSNPINRSLPLPDEVCDVCNGVGTSQNFVKCDECRKNYHFHCLIPPLKKTPKKRGYSWICADCDPTDRENN